MKPPDPALAPLIPTRVPFLQRTSVRLLLGMALLVLCLIAAIVAVMDTIGTRLVKEETSRRIEETGNRVVVELESRLVAAESLTRSLANLIPSAPRDEEQLMPLLRDVLEFNHDTHIAGGGIWFEPYMFDPALVRKSFFWGRNDKDQLQFYEDYNRPGPSYDEARFASDPGYREAFLAAPGYHNEEWYVVVRHLKNSGRGFWSRSYMDPYSYQPMVTYTAPLFDRENRFIGVSTVDLKLEGLQALSENWANQVGGYVIVLDRNNKFITFPELARAKRESTDAKGGRTVDFLLAEEFAQAEPRFAPIAQLTSSFNQKLVEQGRLAPGFDPELARQIDLSSYQINAPEAELIAALIQNPDPKASHSNLVEQQELSSDFHLDRESVISVFNVPSAAWKAVIVKPTEQYVAVAQNIKRQLIAYLSAIVILLLAIAALYQQMAIARPLQSLINRFTRIGEKLQAGETIDRIDERNFENGFKGEVGVLAHALSTMTNELAKMYEALSAESRTLERKVEERTHELRRAQDAALASAHAAGMAEMSASVLHNIGNALNTLNVEIEELHDVLRHDRLDFYERAIGLLKENRENLASYFDQDPKGKLLLDYLLAFGTELKENHDRSHGQLELILKGLAKVNRILATQHQYAKSVNFNEEFDLVTVLEDALSLEAPLLGVAGVQLERRYHHKLTLHAPKIKVMHILINLIRNARESLADSEGERLLRLTVEKAEDGRGLIEIADTGQGIEPEHIARVFNQGFTTKADGQGMGLHYCVGAAEEIGAVLSATSAGKGKGASFTLLIRSVI